MRMSKRIFHIQELLGKTREGCSSQEDKDLFLDAIDGLWFIWSNGQIDEFEEYLKDRDVDIPPWVIAVFATREEAQAWVNSSRLPRNLAHVLIADEYHIILASNDGQRRYLVPDLALAYHIEDLTREGLPPAVAHFDTREQAREWFDRQSDPPVQSVIQIGGEHHLAVYYRNIPYRALFPFSVVKRLEPLRSSGG
jgi:hypothetical protein